MVYQLTNNTMDGFKNENENEEEENVKEKDMENNFIFHWNLKYTKHELKGVFRLILYIIIYKYVQVIMLAQRPTHSTLTHLPFPFLIYLWK